MTDHIEPVDPIALLSSLAAPDGWNERIKVETDPRAARILELITSGNVVPARPRRRRHLRVVTGVVIAASLGGLAAAALWERTPTEPQTLTCWSEAVSPPAAQIGLGWDGQTDPISLCRTAWNGGEFGTDGAPQTLQECVNDAGVVAVIPGTGDTCDTLGLAKYAPLGNGPGDAEALLVLEVERVLIERYNTGSCNTSAEAAADVRQTLDEFGLDHWGILVADNFSEREPCATISFDRSADTVSVVSDSAPPAVGEVLYSEAPSHVFAQEQLDLIFNTETCVTAEAARVGTIQVLNEYELSDWEITILDTFSADEPCARVALDSFDETAIIVSAPRAD